MKQQLLDTWQINHQKNVLLIKHTTDAGMQRSLSTRGGRTVFRQWVHIHNVRMQWLEVCAKDIFKQYGVLEKEAGLDRNLLLNALEDSFKGIEALLSRSWDDGGKVKGFKKGVLPLLGYFISHESHHRGNILLTLKQSGEKIPEPVRWGLWDWGK
jgi:uncharacterized damage-inducible protein DinB